MRRSDLVKDLVRLEVLRADAPREATTSSRSTSTFDLTTPQGELVANILASVAQWERRVIGERPLDAYIDAKARHEEATAAAEEPMQAIRLLIGQPGSAADQAGVAMSCGSNVQFRPRRSLTSRSSSGP